MPFSFRAQPVLNSELGIINRGNVSGSEQYRVVAQINDNAFPLDPSIRTSVPEYVANSWLFRSRDSDGGMEYLVSLVS